MKKQKYGETCYLSDGEGDVILFLHGIPGSAHTWESVAEKLVTQGYRVIILDLLGFGESVARHDNIYMEEQAHMLASLLKSLQIESCIIAAHDFGGPVALTLLRLYPELKVRGLVFTNTNLFTDTPIPPPLLIAKIPVLGRMFYNLAFGSRIGIRMMYMAACKQKQQQPWEAFKQHLTDNGLRSTSYVFHYSIQNIVGNYRAVEDMLSRITIPTLILWATNDPFFSVATGQRIADSIPNSTIHFYEETGHFVPEEQPERVQQDINVFLRHEIP